MSATHEAVLARLAEVPLPGGGDLVSADMLRALEIENGRVRFVIEAPDAARPAASARSSRPPRAHCAACRAWTTCRSS